MARLVHRCRLCVGGCYHIQEDCGQFDLCDD